MQGEEGHAPTSLYLNSLTEIIFIGSLGRPDMTFAVDWTLNNNYLSISSLMMPAETAKDFNGCLLVCFLLIRDNL